MAYCVLEEQQQQHFPHAMMHVQHMRCQQGRPVHGKKQSEAVA